MARNIQYKKYTINNILIHNTFSMKKLLAMSRGYFCSGVKPISLTFNEESKAAYLKLSNPKKRNVLSLETMNLLLEALDEIEQKTLEKKTKIVILEGEGPVFCSGHNLKELSDSPNPKTIFDFCAKLMMRVKEFPLPTLCRINGIAAAAGFQLALSCDMILATEKSTFLTPGIKWGLFCSTPAVELIRSINSRKKAMEMLFFGQPINAQEALQYGLINKIVNEDDLEEETNKYVKKTLNLSSEVIQLGKKILNQQEQLEILEAYKITAEGMQENLQKEDCKEGITAFKEKRHPQFKN